MENAFFSALLLKHWKLVTGTVSCQLSASQVSISWDLDDFCLALAAPSSSYILSEFLLPFELVIKENLNSLEMRD